MRITKKEANRIGLHFCHICEFHIHNPDQTAILDTCEECKIIEDPCGCDIMSRCEDCDPDFFKNKENDSK